MTHNQLRTFVVLATTSSVHEAAKRLFVTQPAVSAAVGALQQELGVRLVERDGRRLRLTGAGQVLATYGRRILGLWEEAVVATVAGADPERGRLRVAAVTTAGEHLLPAPLGTFRESHAGVEIVLEVGNRRGVWDLLRSGEVDLAVGGRPPLGGGFVSLGEAENDLLLVSAPGLLPRRTGPKVSVAELGGRTWLVRETGSGTRATTEELLRELDIAPTLLTLGSNGAVRESAVAGLGVALLSRAAVSRQLAAGDLEELRAGPLPLSRPWHLVARGDSDLPATSGLFVEHLLAAGVFRPVSAAGRLPTALGRPERTPSPPRRRSPASQGTAARGPQR